MYNRFENDQYIHLSKCVSEKELQEELSYGLTNGPPRRAILALFFLNVLSVFR